MVFPLDLQCLSECSELWSCCFIVTIVMSRICARTSHWQRRWDVGRQRVWEPRGAEYVSSWEDGPFDPDNGFIAMYLERMELYFSANSVPKTKQVPVFLNLIGGDTYELLCNLLAPNKPAETSLVGLYKTLCKHFEPNKDGDS